MKTLLAWFVVLILFLTAFALAGHAWCWLAAGIVAGVAGIEFFLHRHRQRLSQSPLSWLRQAEELEERALQVEESVAQEPNKMVTLLAHDVTVLLRSTAAKLRQWHLLKR